MGEGSPLKVLTLVELCWANASTWRERLEPQLEKYRRIRWLRLDGTRDSCQFFLSKDMSGKRTK
jgi:hypothetical protein